jgi:hypothetical protein
MIAMLLHTTFEWQRGRDLVSDAFEVMETGAKQQFSSRNSSEIQNSGIEFSA